jgi:hypothetical protein
VNLIVAMLTPWLKLPAAGAARSGQLAAPHRLSRLSPPPRPREKTLTRGIPFSIPATRES